MIRAILVVFIISTLAMAGYSRGDAWTPTAEDISESSRLPGTPTPGKGANVLFIFAAQSESGGNSWGDKYWNPIEGSYPGTWTYDTVNPSSVEPLDDPYHWNGGLGTALDALGYSWEWYPTFDGASGDYQTILPSATMLADYDVVFYWVGDYWNPALGPGITPETMAVLETYMTAGGPLVFTGQDIIWSGVPATWFDTWFGAGAIVEDVYSGETALAGFGIAGTFAEGWSGTALVENFYVTPGSFYPDDMGANGFIGDGGTYEFGCYDDANKRIFSTMQFETCAAAEVEDIADLLMTWLDIGGALENSTWGEIKTSF